MPWIVRRTVLPRAWSRDASSPCSASRFHKVRCLIGMARALVARQLLRRRERGIGIQQQGVIADPAEPLAVRTPYLPFVPRPGGVELPAPAGGVLGLGPGVRVGDMSAAAADRRT